MSDDLVKRLETQADQAPKWPAAAMLEAADCIKALTAERDGLLRGACEGAVNWLDALLHQVQATSCEPDDPEAFDEVLMGAGLWLHNARAVLKGETP